MDEQFLKGWLSGVWDGEGSVACYKTKQSPRSYTRALILVNSDKTLIDKVVGYLTFLGITTCLYSVEDRHNCFGKKKMWRVYINNASSIRMFAELVGFQSQEKIDKLKVLMDSYIRYCEVCNSEIGWHKRTRRFCDDCLSPLGLRGRISREKKQRIQH